MKRKRYATEDKIRILREAEGSQNIAAVCREKNISEVTFHRWKKELGQMGVPEAKRLKELERENSELKKMLAEALLAKRVLEYVVEKKTISPGHKRQMVKRVVAEGLCSGRAGCRIMRLARATWWYEPGKAQERHEPLRVRVHELSLKYPRYGFRRIRALLRQEGWQVGKRHVQRVRRLEGLRVPPTKRRGVRRGRSTGLPTRATHRGHVWTWDFIADATQRGGSLRMLTVLDEYTRECHVLRPDRALKSADVIAWMKKAVAQHGAPEFIRSDNGSEFIAKELQGWLAKEKIKTIYIEPGSPWQNGFVESFHGRFRDECLNREQLWTLTEARVVIEDFRIQYNTQRPHSKLGYRSPADYVAQLPRSPVPVGLGLPTPEIDRPRLMLQPQINAQTNSPGGSKR